MIYASNVSVAAPSRMLIMTHLIDTGKRTAILEQNLPVLDAVLKVVEVQELLDLRHNFRALPKAAEHTFPDPRAHGIANGEVEFLHMGPDVPRDLDCRG